jgi:MFS family permease
VADPYADVTPFRLRSLLLSIYIPTLLFSVGQGLVIPVIPLFAKDLGAGLGLVGLVVTMRGIGSMAGDVPSGVLVARLGGRTTMGIGTGATAVVALAMGFAPSVILLAVLMLLAGLAFAQWQVARLAFVTDTVPGHYRGRALALVGGVNRVGVFIGPALGGFLGTWLGLEAVFFAQAFVCVAALVIEVAFVHHNPSRRRDAAGIHPGFHLLTVLSENRRSFLTAGLVAVSLVFVRSGRQLLIPLWGDHIGMDVAAIGLVFSIGSAIDMTLFYPVGVVMDRFGRRFTIVPSILLLGGSLALLPLTTGFTSMMLLGILSGFGNGLGSGAVMTLGSDLAPRGGSGEFLGVWRLIGDAGQVTAPLAVGAIAQLFTLGAAAVATGGLGLLGAFVMAFLVSETFRRDSPG